MKQILVISAVIIGGAVTAWFFLGQSNNLAASGFTIESSPAETRNISRIVASSGAITPLVTVEVGSQLSGQILDLKADFNDTVQAGDLLARIDPQTFETRVREAEASLEVASAQVSVSEANLERARVDLNVTQRTFDRARELLDRGVFSESQYDATESGLAAAQAGLLVAEANLRNALATRLQRQANLENARVDLERTYIRSPIEGVVIDRQIDQGQTVAASFNAPVLFMIAQDLSRIQIEAQVDEADIGQIDEGQSVSFDVDAYPGRSFEGVVTQVRLASTNSQNVVTYTVVVEANNPGQRLLPGMTANVSITTGEVKGALTVPNSALRFTPRGGAEALVAPSQSGQSGGGSGGTGIIDRLTEELELTDDQRRDAERSLRATFQDMRAQMSAPGGNRPNPQAMVRRALSDILTSEQMARYDTLAQERSSRRNQVRRDTVWVETPSGQLQEQPVGLGLSDGQYTQVLSSTLREGDRVITRVRETRG